MEKSATVREGKTIQNIFNVLKDYRFRISRLTSGINALIFIIFGVGLIVFVNWNMRQDAVETVEQKARIILDRNYATHMYFTRHLSGNPLINSIWSSRT